MMSLYGSVQNLISIFEDIATEDFETHSNNEREPLTQVIFQEKTINYHEQD